MGFATPPISEHVHRVVERNADAYATEFYTALLADPEAYITLSQELVRGRLHGLLSRWIQELFHPGQRPEDARAAQQRIGQMHARVRVPIRLVSVGGRALKRAITSTLAREPESGVALHLAVQYVYELIDRAVESMLDAYLDDTDRLTRTEESYRIFSLTQDLQAERERQKAQLLECAQRLVERHYWSPDTGATREDAMRELSDSPFGLWLHHKAAVIFEADPEVARIREHIALIEGELLPRLARVRDDQSQARAVVADFHQRIDTMKGLLAAMFDRHAATAEVTDGGTRLLSRRYFPTVAAREIDLARTHQGSFAVLMIEIDALSETRERLGLEATDAIVAQVAETVADQVRAGDFVFRIGDGRFAVLAVEVERARAVAISEGLRQAIGALSLRVPGGARASATASIGIAVYQGHPDYQRLLDQADGAVKNAREAGGNRCAIFQGP